LVELGHARRVEPAAVGVQLAGEDAVRGGDDIGIGVLVDLQDAIRIARLVHRAILGCAASGRTP